jgi:AraC family transcriptional regulator
LSSAPNGPNGLTITKLISTRLRSLEGGVLNWLGYRLYREAQWGDAISTLAIEGLALEMIAEMSRRRLTEAAVPYWLRQARDLIHAQFTQSLTVSSIAETVGVHPVHLARMFRKTYRCTIGDYVRELRTELACREISSTNLPLSEIASKAGFYDQGHLSRIVKERTGMTPSQYRSLCRPRVIGQAKAGAIDWYCGRPW